VLACAIAASFAHAELPPSAYKERQEKAPEALVIKVQSVSKRETTQEKWTQIEFTVKAEVQKVERSATKLAPGATIEIRYSQRHYSQPIVGPSEVPALKEGHGTALVDGLPVAAKFDHAARMVAASCCWSALSGTWIGALGSSKRYGSSEPWVAAGSAAFAAAPAPQIYLTPTAVTVVQR
jgi:hypothetical protein